MNDRTEDPQWPPEMIEGWKRENLPPTAARRLPVYAKRSEEGMTNEILVHRSYQTDTQGVTIINPTRNAVIVELVEHQMPNGTIERQTRIGIECKDNRLAQELTAIAQRIRV